MKKSLYRKACKLTEKLLNSMNINYDSEEMELKKGYVLRIEVERIMPEEQDIYYGDPGTVVDLAFYVTHNGTEVDGVSVSLTPFEKHYPADLAYLIGMFSE